MSPSKPREPLSPLQHQIMGVVWRDGAVTAEDVVAALSRPLKNATVRTMLRRLEAKGYLRHTARGRAFVYHPRVPEAHAATGALKRVMQRFFGGSASRLLVGLVDEGMIDPEELKALSRRLGRKPQGGGRSRG
jgi:predicted transcriptional regulator